jgi:hypothetical protein
MSGTGVWVLHLLPAAAASSMAAAVPTLTDAARLAVDDWGLLAERS